MTAPRAVATCNHQGQKLEEELKAFSISRLRQIFSSVSPNQAVLGTTEVLQVERARNMLRNVKPIIWKSPSGEFLPQGYAGDTARLLSLLPPTEVFTAIVQISDKRPSENVLYLNDEFVIDYRNYAVIADSVSRRKCYAASHGEAYASNRQIAIEIGLTESTFSRNM